VATLEDLEARVAALEASHADYRAVLAAVNALGADQRKHSLGLANLGTRMTALETRVDEGLRLTDARFRSVDEQLAEIKDLIIGRHNG
jgi:uncharacterized coiled-coil protein SlyX